MSRTPAVVLFAFGLLFLSSAAKATCVEEKHKLGLSEFAEERVAYVCTVDAKGTTLEVQFHKLSSAAAGMILGETPLSSTLAEVLGGHKLVPNEVSELYKDVFQRFSRSFSLDHLYPSFSGDAVDGNKIKAVKAISFRIPPYDTGELGGFGGIFFPATKEYALLKKKVIPPGMKYYGEPYCSEYIDNNMSKCRMAIMYFWRGLSIDDVESFSIRIAELNRNFRNYYYDASEYKAKYLLASMDVRYMRFVEFLAQQGLPEDFLILELAYPRLEGCWGLDSYIVPRDMVLKVAHVQNTSNQSVTLDGIFVSNQSSASAGLHTLASETTPTRSAKLIETGPQALAPGESLVIPVRIEFPAPKLLDEISEEAAEHRQALYAELGISELKANGTDYAVPHPKDYAYGPEIALSGFRVNGQRVDLERMSANFVELVASVEDGSCPYLLAWDQADREWIDHGKILHEAKGKQGTETETVSFSGFQSKFRLEEREPELASIDHAELTLSLNGGETLTLKPEHARLTARDQDYLQLYWGEAVEIEFELPDGVAADDVLESHLHVTGFYERYSELIPASASDDGPAQDDPLAEVKNVMNGETGPKPEMCPLPLPPALPTNTKDEAASDTRLGPTGEPSWLQ